MNSAKLIMVVGLPGTGKSTLSRKLAVEIGAEHLNSDVIRAELGLRGQYTPTDKARVYQALIERTETLLSAGTSVIVDATLYRKDLRRPYQKLARRLACPISWIELNANEETIERRVEKQRTFSEADLAVYQKIRARYESLTAPHLRLGPEFAPLESMVTVAKKYMNYEQTTT
ncbi:AAA family ATPase [Neolewinella antarctica]|uniref:Kinase n=1 Tax=Neolewinella antarctica TaxID=442734 RepID=A0ABX0X9F9_9BACT|nr:ATP-binding protein [Neolewinella antarctica]NJC25594.1 hypothetical protein [Neolewinella antarctica]